MKPIQRSEKVESVVIRQNIATGATGQVTERIKAEGTIEGMRVIFPPGPSGLLHIVPYVRRHGGKLDPLLTFPSGSNGYISGDDMILPFPVTFAVKNDEEIVILYDNTDTVAHELMVDVFIDYYGGGQRIIGGALGGGR